MEESLLTPIPREGSRAPAWTCFSVLLSRFQGAQPPGKLAFVFPVFLHGYGSVGQSQTGTCFVWLPAPRRHSSSRDFAAGSGQGTGPGTCCRSRGSAPDKDSCWREEEGGGGRRPAGNASLLSAGVLLCSSKTGWWCWALMTHPSHTRQPLLTTHYCLATTHMKCRSGEQSFPLAQLQCRGLSSLSVFPQGRKSLEISSCQLHVPANSSHEATCSRAEAISPLLQNCLCLSAGAYLHCLSQDQSQFRGKCAPEGFGGCKSQRPGSPPFLWGPGGTELWSKHSRLGAAAGVSPRASLVHLSYSSTCHGCGYTGDKEPS